MAKERRELIKAIVRASLPVMEGDSRSGGPWLQRLRQLGHNTLFFLSYWENDKAPCLKYTPRSLVRDTLQGRIKART